MIYVTPFDPVTLKATGLSTDSGFASLAHVVEMLGEPVHEAPALLVYGDDAARVLFSRVAFYTGELKPCS